MTTGSLCLTEILKSWKSCSSNRLASQTADSTSASAVALPYFCISRGSSEPALTPIRIETPASLAARGDLLDLVVELADVARVDAHGGAAGVDRGEDVLGLEVDVGDHRDLAVPGDLGQRVGVVLAGAGHPDDVAAGGRELGDLLQRGVDVGRGGGAHRLHRDRRVAADLDLADLDLARRAPRREHGRGQGGIPSETVMRPVSPTRRPRGALPGMPNGTPGVSARSELDRVDDVGVDQQHRHADQRDGHRVGDRQRLGDVDVAGVGPAAQPGDPALEALPQRAGDVPAVQRQQRDEVEDEQRDVAATR